MQHLQSTKNVRYMPGSTQNVIQTATWYRTRETHSNSSCVPTRGCHHGGYIIIGRLPEGRKRLRIICCNNLRG